MRHKLYCDQDGVFADFATPASEFFNVDFSGWVTLSAEDWGRYRDAHPKMWEEIPVMPFAYDLWSVVRDYDLAILTAVPHRGEWADVGEQKLRWFQKHFDFDNVLLYAVQREEKQTYAMQGDGTPNILIDDMLKNIEEWRHAGGIGIHYTPSADAVLNVQQELSFLHLLETT